MSAPQPALGSILRLILGPGPLLFYLAQALYLGACLAAPRGPASPPGKKLAAALALADILGMLGLGLTLSLAGLSLRPFSLPFDALLGAGIALAGIGIAMRGAFPLARGLAFLESLPATLCLGLCLFGSWSPCLVSSAGECIFTLEIQGQAPYLWFWISLASIVFGACGLFCMGLALFATPVPASNAKINRTRRLGPYFVAALFCLIGFVTIGGGMRSLRPWLSRIGIYLGRFSIDHKEAARVLILGAYLGALALCLYYLVPYLRRILIDKGFKPLPRQIIGFILLFCLTLLIIGLIVLEILWPSTSMGYLVSWLT